MTRSWLFLADENRSIEWSELFPCLLVQPQFTSSFTVSSLTVMIHNYDDAIFCSILHTKCYFCWNTSWVNTHLVIFKRTILLSAPHVTHGVLFTPILCCSWGSKVLNHFYSEVDSVFGVYLEKLHQNEMIKRMPRIIAQWRKRTTG